ncbi:hypothetical protein DNTS_003922, partial [Danionella cerebrum]
LTCAGSALPYLQQQDDDGGEVSVEQSMTILRKSEHQWVSIPCVVNVSSCSLPHTISWFVFRTDSHQQINLVDHHEKFTLEQDSLRIESLSKADCGVYYCFGSLLERQDEGAQAFGQGTVLKVSEGGLSIYQLLLLTLLVLLSVYSLVILTLCTCIKTGKFQSVFKKGLGKRGSKEEWAQQLRFSGVVQELYERNLPCDQNNVPQTQNTVFQNVQPHEDIYQNLDE